MNKILNDGYDKVKYLVLVNGKIINRTLTEVAAENFVNTLPADIKESAQIVAATADDKQILLG